MGLSLHGNKKRDVDAEKHLRRMHKTTPFIESPLTGADHDHLVFSQRHEANTVELFFDLFFVANLATFTTYHSVTDVSYLVAYIGFFGILWSTWFQVTLHDVRFARDSMYERVCKTVQFIVFIGLALVGSEYNPGTKGDEQGTNTTFRILCYTLIISRATLAIQYGVVLFFTIRAHYSKLYLPLGLMIGVYSLAAVAFGAMTPAFRAQEQAHQGIYIVWYIVMLLEAIAVIAISASWRMLSFKKTHLMERMSLLTLIVIGEGAIGVTKTVSRMMGKSGLDVECCFLIMCIIMVLVLLWALYFDNFPHGHFGTIRQQIWSCLHFPFQLAIVGVVEGSQQVAIARYVIKNWYKIDKAVEQYCLSENLDGAKLRDALLTLVHYWQFEKKAETRGFTAQTARFIYKVGNTTGICSKANAQSYRDAGSWPRDFRLILYTMFDGVYEGIGMKLPVDKLEKDFATQIAIASWKVVYLYYWTSFCILIACSIIFLFLIRRHKADVFDFVSVIIRLLALVAGCSLIAIVGHPTSLDKILSSAGVLPACLVLLFLILFFDKISAAFSNRRLRKSGQPYALEVADEHHGGGGAGHGPAHEHDPARKSLIPEHRKSAAWSIHEDTQPLVPSSPLHTEETEYHGRQQSYAMTPLLSPPIASASPGAENVHGGYTPVGAYENHGA